MLQGDIAFVPAWKTCHNGTAVKHLDVDAPRVLRGLFEQQVNDVWQHRSVQCSAGDYISDDYCAPCALGPLLHSARVNPQHWGWLVGGLASRCSVQLVVDCVRKGLSEDSRVCCRMKGCV